MGGGGEMRGEKGFSFFNLCDFTPCDCSLGHNCHINQGVPVCPSLNSNIFLHFYSL
jgi:hypothetical protein